MLIISTGNLVTQPLTTTISLAPGLLALIGSGAGDLIATLYSLNVTGVLQPLACPNFFERCF